MQILIFDKFVRVVENRSGKSRKMMSHLKWIIFEYSFEFGFQYGRSALVNDVNVIGLKWTKRGIQRVHDHVLNKRFEIPFLIRFHLFKLNQKQVFEWWAKSEIRSRERNSGGPKVKRYADESRDYLLPIQKWTKNWTLAYMSDITHIDDSLMSVSGFAQIYLNLRDVECWERLACSLQL